MVLSILGWRFITYLGAWNLPNEVRGYVSSLSVYLFNLFCIIVWEIGSVESQKCQMPLLLTNMLSYVYTKLRVLYNLYLFPPQRIFQSIWRDIFFKTLPCGTLGAGDSPIWRLRLPFARGRHFQTAFSPLRFGEWVPDYQMLDVWDNVYSAIKDQQNCKQQATSV